MASAKAEDLASAQGDEAPAEPSPSVGELLRALKADPAQLYEDTPEAREQVLEDYRAILAELEAKARPLFGEVPKAELEVIEVPEYQADGAIFASYVAPAMDGSRPGRFKVNLSDLKGSPRYSMFTLAAHEGVPGHHFQNALAQEQEHLPLIRRGGSNPAYGEGWALYAERLMLEEGIAPTALDRVGVLAFDLFRAARLVVDTGLHAKRWSREQAIEYLMANSDFGREQAESEVDRYVVWPGQTCSYKFGQLHFLALRARAKEELGERFSLPAFHDAMLLQGGLPFHLLDELFERWLEEQKAAG